MTLLGGSPIVLSPGFLPSLLRLLSWAGLIRRRLLLFNLLISSLIVHRGGDPARASGESCLFSIGQRVGRSGTRGQQLSTFFWKRGEN
jgi:hypothetical protein